MLDRIKKPILLIGGYIFIHAEAGHVLRNMESYMNIQSLECFVAVAEHGSFSRAAQRIYVTQPAVSHHIASLENELGVKLFERTGNSVALTEAGIECLNVARLILSDCKALMQTAAHFSGRLVGPFCVGYVNSRSGELLFPILKKLCAVYPELKIDQYHVSITQALKELREKHLDVIVIDEPSINRVEWIEYCTVKTGDIVAVLSNEHPLAGQDSLSFDQIKTGCILFGRRDDYPDGYDILMEECRAHGVDPRRVQTESSWESVLMRVRLGHGIFMTSNAIMRSYLDELKVLPIRDVTRGYNVAAAWRKGEDTAVMRELRRIINEFNGGSEEDNIS